MGENKKKTDPKLIIAALAVVLILAVVIAVIIPRLRTATNVKSLNEIKEKLNIDLKEPENAADLKYDIVNNSIAKVTYSKKLPDGSEMHFIMRSSYAMEEDLQTFSTDPQFSEQPIFMTTICDDGSEVEVESYVALDKDSNMKYMKALWMDNDKYYSMITEDLVTREDFLQEVNRVIIANHVSFNDSANVTTQIETQASISTASSTESNS